MNTRSKENVDPGEIQKFTDIAAHWWDPGSEFAPLHAINPLRTQYINLHSPLNGLNVLDVGCGGGLLSEAMAELGANVTGIDMGEAALGVAKLHLLESGKQVDYLKNTAEKMAAKHAGEFDIVTCLEMLEHVPDFTSVVTACSELVKPGGDVYFSTINRNPKAWLMAVVGAEYVLNLLPKGTHEYDKLIKPSELDAAARGAGLHTQSMTGLHFNPFSRRYRLGAGVDVNYMIHTIKSD